MSKVVKVNNEVLAALRKLMHQWELRSVSATVRRVLSERNSNVRHQSAPQTNAPR